VGSYLLFALSTSKLCVAMPIVLQRDFTSHPDLMKRLIYSKYLLNRARLLQQEGNELACAEAILTAHDSVEMLIRVIAEFVNAKQSERFMEQLRLIEKETGKEPPCMAAMDRLNHLRVSFKHKGNLPHPANVAELMPSVTDFCPAVTSQYLGLDYETVSLAELIQNAGARAKVKEAEAAKTADKIRDAICALRMAFDILHDEAREKCKSILIRGVDAPGFEFLPRVGKAISSLAKIFKLEALTLAVHQLVETVNGMLLGIEPAKFRRFSEITPFPSYRGFQRNVEYLWRPKRPELRPEDFDFCHEFVIDFALRLVSSR